MGADGLSPQQEGPSVLEVVGFGLLKKPYSFSGTLLGLPQASGIPEEILDRGEEHGDDLTRQGTGKNTAHALALQRIADSGTVRGRSFILLFFKIVIYACST